MLAPVAPHAMPAVLDLGMESMQDARCGMRHGYSPRSSGRYIHDANLHSTLHVLLALPAAARSTCSISALPDASRASRPRRNMTSASRYSPSAPKSRNHRHKSTGTNLRAGLGSRARTESPVTFAP
ncbi:hypothetical protein CTRI78_v006373 [Colletotrichum trifolii]|uniref:Uncharacterized protein n=1 Tax=Colletotrichum trifolii TaxID=5466 RepID=A0A4R8RH31_COLTR|nr:hypothetical protein CTRI78_v006373 [Colletotrichum trifolii]